jgi:hypothetical protein
MNLTAIPTLTLNILSTVTLCLINFSAFAQAKPDRILTREELRACMQQKQANDAEDSTIKQRQSSYAQDQAKFKAEQNELDNVANKLRTRQADSRT